MVVVLLWTLLYYPAWRAATQCEQRMPGGSDSRTPIIFFLECGEGVLLAIYWTMHISQAILIFFASFLPELKFTLEQRRAALRSFCTLALSRYFNPDSVDGKNSKSCLHVAYWAKYNPYNMALPSPTKMPDQECQTTRGATPRCTVAVIATYNSVFHTISAHYSH